MNKNPSLPDISCSLATHTIIIPTYNRANLLKLIIRYYLSNAPRAILLVLDSSDLEISQHNRKFLTGLSPNIFYIEYEKEISTAKKLLDGLIKTTTPTVSFCADDDIVFPMVISESVKFLNGNPDYVAAHGYYLNFTVSEFILSINEEYISKSNESTNTLERILDNCTSYQSLFYAVFRTCDLRKIFEDVVNCSSLHYQELFQTNSALILGKVKCLPKIYCMRRNDAAADPHRKDWQTYYWFSENPIDFMKEYFVYRNALKKFYFENCKDKKKLVLEIFDLLLDNFHMIFFVKSYPIEYILNSLYPLFSLDNGNISYILEVFKKSKLNRNLLTFGFSRKIDKIIWKITNNYKFVIDKILSVMNKYKILLDIKMFFLKNRKSRRSERLFKVGDRNLMIHISNDISNLIESNEIERALKELNHYCH